MRLWVACLAPVLAPLLALAAGGAQAADPPPLSVYADDPAIGSVVLSPDGRKVAALQRRNGLNVLTLLPAGEGAAQVVPTGALDLRGVEWIDSDHLLLYRSAILPDSEITPRQRVTQGVALDVRSRKAVVLLEHTSSTVPVLAGGTVDMGAWNGKPQVFTRGIVAGPAFTLFRIDAATGVGVSMTDPSFDAEGWIVGPTGKILADRRIDAMHHRWMLRVHGGGDWRGVALADDDVWRLAGPGRTEGTVLIRRGPDLLEIAPDGKLGAPLQPQGAREEGETTTPTSRRLVALTVGDDHPRTISLDPRLAANFAKAERAFKGASVQLATVDEALDGLIVLVHAPRSTGVYYWVDLTTGHAETLGERYPSVPPDQVGETRALDVTAGDGLKLRAFLTLPPGRSAQPAEPAPAAVVLVHGGPDDRDDMTFDPVAQALASRGYAVLKVNFRGSEGAGEAVRAAGHDAWGRGMQTDLSDAVAEAARQGLIDPKRVCIAGKGYGGYAAAAGVTLQKGVYRCAVAIDGVYDLPSALALPDVDMRGGGWVKVLQARSFFDDAARSTRALEAISPLAHAADASAPLLLVHSAEDKQGMRMHAALDRAGKANRDAVVDIGKTAPVQRFMRLDAMVRFLAEHNPA